MADGGTLNRTTGIVTYSQQPAEICYRCSIPGRDDMDVTVTALVTRAEIRNDAISLTVLGTLICQDGAKLRVALFHRWSPTHGLWGLFLPLRLEHLTDLDLRLLSGHRVRTAAHPFQGLLHRLHLPQPEAGDELLGFRERPVDHQRLRAFAHRGGRRGRHQARHRPEPPRLRQRL